MAALQEAAQFDRLRATERLEAIAFAARPQSPRQRRLARVEQRTQYEIPFNRHFYVWKPPRPLAVIDAELKVVTDRIVQMIQGLSQ